MARHTGGWVKLWKKVIYTDIGANFLLLGIWMTLLSWANYKESTICWKGQPRKLERGEIVTSVKELATFGEVDRKTVSKWLNYLSLRQSISIEKAHDGMLIKILNYDRYQSQDAEWSHDDGHRGPTSMDTDMDTEVPHSEELKNKRNKESTRPVLVDTKPVQVESAEDLLELFDERRLKEFSDLYPDDDFVGREAIKAVQYYRDNPRKKPKTGRGWKLAFSSWLNRGWRYHVKTIPGENKSAPGYRTITQMTEDGDIPA